MCTRMAGPCTSACARCSASAPPTGSATSRPCSVAAARAPKPRWPSSEALIGFLRTEKQGDPRASVPELLRRAEQQGIIGSALSVDRTTVWRACRRMGLPTRARPSKREGDMRRWRYPHRMQCVLADGKHFRAGAGRPCAAWRWSSSTTPPAMGCTLW